MADVVDCGAAFVWREGGRAKGRLNTGSWAWVEEDEVVDTVDAVEVVDALGGAKLGMPLTRLAAFRDARLEGAGAGAAVEGVLDRTSEAREAFFCSGCWAGRLARGMDGTDAFLRSWSVGADGWRSWDWLDEDLSTGRRDVGLGSPDGDGRGMAEGWWLSIVGQVNAMAWMMSIAAASEGGRVSCSSQTRQAYPNETSSLSSFVGVWGQVMI